MKIKVKNISGQWVELKLSANVKIKYNLLINKIGKLKTREISHANTFSVAKTSENMLTLGLNVFNYGQNATALNSKFEAKIFLNEVEIQAGVLVINNVESEKINVNFIDQTLNLLDSWSKITVNDLFNSETIARSNELDQLLAELNFYFPSGHVLSKVDNELCSFPNALNAIGDKFQIDSDGNREINAFNPFQSRPLFNVKAILKYACQVFGYTAVNTTTSRDLYVVSEGLGDDIEDFPPELININTGRVSEYEADDSRKWGTTFSYKEGIEYAGRVLKINKSTFNENVVTDDLCLLVPAMQDNTNGYIKWKIKDFSTRQHDVYGLYIQNHEKIISRVLNSNQNPLGSNVEITLDKNSIINNENEELIGVYLDIYSTSEQLVSPTFFISCVEEVHEKTPVAYDEFGQYVDSSVQLNYAYPEINLKKFISGILKQSGGLMSVFEETKTVYFFNYNLYYTFASSGIYKNWDKNFLPYENIIFNTNYGKDFAKSNIIGLSEPFLGNTYDMKIGNSNDNSKLGDTASNLSETFKDVSKVETTKDNVPYRRFEYTNLGLGLVEKVRDIPSGLKQVKANESQSYGTMPALCNFANVNYRLPPRGLYDWYMLVGSSVKVEAKFLFSSIEFKELDLYRPVYISKLGGYFIVEEIAEYSDEITPVTVKLIKL